MTWTIATYDLDGDVVQADVPWEYLRVIYTRNGPGSVEFVCSMTKVPRSTIATMERDYRVSHDSTLVADGRIDRLAVDTNYNRRKVRVFGQGIAGMLAHRLVDWEARYEPVTEDPVNINTLYGATAEDILNDSVARTQDEPGGDLQIVAGTHTGGSHTRRRWYCAEDGIYLSEIFDDMSRFGLDWAVTPTLTDPSFRELNTWSPARGSDLTGSVVLDGQDFLDTLTYEEDGTAIITRGHSVADGDCDPYMGDETDEGALAQYGLLEKFEAAGSDAADDAQDAAHSVLSPNPVVSFDVWYELPKGPAIGAVDIADIITVSSSRDAGWTFSRSMVVEEIEIVQQLPDDDANTFVRFGCSEYFVEESSI